MRLTCHNSLANFRDINAFRVDNEDMEDVIESQENDHRFLVCFLREHASAQNDSYSNQHDRQGGPYNSKDHCTATELERATDYKEVEKNTDAIHHYGRNT